MPDRIIAIGDVHGCAAALAGLIDRIEPTGRDTVVMLGDCVDRGPDSRGVIEYVQALAERCTVIPILGNHEEMLLAAVDRPATGESWLGFGGRETLASYRAQTASELPHDHILFMRTWIDYWQTSTHFFGHGNYDPRVALDRQEWGYQRWQSLRDGLPEPHENGKTAVLGHTSQKDGEVLDAGYLVCIDTYCCGGKWLTALDTTSGTYWQVDREGRPRANELPPRKQLS